MVIGSLDALQQWAPFRIDALGLVTILGADRVDLVLGQLTISYLTEWLPLLGAYTIASNRIVEPLSGFALYNITDGIMVNNLSGWFCRWLLCQDFGFSSSVVHIKPVLEQRRQRFMHLLWPRLIGVLALVPVILSILISDWWGLVNGVAMLGSVIVRQIVVGQSRRAVDLAVDESEKTSCELVKVLVTIPNGKIVIIHTSRGIVIDCLLTTPRPPNSTLYTTARAAGWACFGAQLVSLGMASLVCQLVTVVLLVLFTLLVAWQIGVDDSRVGRKLELTYTNTGVSFRAAAYARLNLTPKEERSMLLWNLFPHETNDAWWNKYEKAKENWDS
ncbi:hypothetical protein QBC43DRAFT_333436 [Cladorrhinum sp. PSN259]|nr:hypothetical protein QBC43DRAFT_333436 [Cladorrhinum sp. PSN259]